jgi:hypothetical protein
MKIKKHQAFEINPSLTDIEGIKEVTRNIKNQSELAVHTKTGELFELMPVKSLTTLTDSLTFTKVYTNSLSTISDLTVPGLKLLCYIMKNLKPGKDCIKLRADMCNKYCGYKTKLSYYKGLEELLEKNLIFRTEDEYEFWININYFFNGDRLNLVNVEEYNSKKLEKEKENMSKNELISNFEK